MAQRAQINVIGWSVVTVLSLVRATAFLLLQSNGSPTASKQRVRGFILFVLVAGVVFVLLRQQQNETPPAPAQPVAAQSIGAKPTPAPLTPAPRGQASEYNYMKRALDRARDVTEQSRARTQESQNP
jgi:hypothetical protein